MVLKIANQSKQLTMKEYANHIRAYDQVKNGSLENTIIAYVDNKFGVVAAAKELKTHKNTIKYRLELLPDVCRLDTHKAENMVRLYMELINDN